MIDNKKLIIGNEIVIFNRLTQEVSSCRVVDIVPEGVVLYDYDCQYSKMLYYHNFVTEKIYN